MNDNVDIFICTHKDFNIYPKNSVYKIIHGGENVSVHLKQYTETSTELSPMQYSLAEGSRMYWLYKNYDFKDYVGINHYRKYFDFFENVPNMDEIFKHHDIVTLKPMNIPSVMSNYYTFHNIKDLIEMYDISKSLFPELSDSFYRALNGRILYHCNMFIMKSDDYKEYCSVVFQIIKEFCKTRNWRTDNDIEKYVINHNGEYLKPFYPNNDVKYQSRILGYLLERLTSIYISSKFSNPCCYNLKITEKKYV